VDLRMWLPCRCRDKPGAGWLHAGSHKPADGTWKVCPECKGYPSKAGVLDWVIVGGESGPKARPCNVEWIRDVVRQCQEAGVPCFVKQLGANVEVCDIIDAADYFPGLVKLSPARRPNARVHLADRKGGDPAEWPEDLRVREFPWRSRTC